MRGPVSGSLFVDYDLDQFPAPLVAVVWPQTGVRSKPRDVLKMNPPVLKIPRENPG